MNTHKLFWLAGCSTLIGGALMLSSCNEQAPAPQATKEKVASAKKKSAKRKSKASEEEAPFLIGDADWMQFWSNRHYEEKQKFTNKNDAIQCCKESAAEAIYWLNAMLEKPDLAQAGLGKVTAAYALRSLAVKELLTRYQLSEEECNSITRDDDAKIVSMVKILLPQGGIAVQSLAEFLYSDDVPTTYMGAALLCNLYLSHVCIYLSGVQSSSQESIGCVELAGTSFLEFYWTYLHFTMLYGAENYNEANECFFILDEVRFKDIYMQLQSIKKDRYYNSAVIQERVDFMLPFFKKFAK